MLICISFCYCREVLFSWKSFKIWLTIWDLVFFRIFWLFYYSNCYNRLLKTSFEGKGPIYCALPELKGKYLFLQQNCILNNELIWCFNPVEVLISNYNTVFSFSKIFVLQKVKPECEYTVYSFDSSTISGLKRMSSCQNVELYGVYGTF